MENLEPFGTVGEIVKWCRYLGKQQGGVLKKLNIELSYDPTIPILGIYPKESKRRVSKRYLHTHIIAVLFTIAKREKQPMCPWTDEWISKMWSVHIKEYYSVLKRKEILSHATTCMNLENNIISKISQSKKANTTWIYISLDTEVSKVVKFFETENGS